MPITEKEYSPERDIQYEFLDVTERLRTHEEDIIHYIEDADLGRNVDVTLLVKWTNQRYHDENLRAMFTDSWDPVAGISRKNAGRHRNRYYDGQIINIGLNNDYLTNEGASLVRDVLQPTGIDSYGSLTAFACADSIVLSEEGDVARPSKIIGHPNFARLHSVEFNERGNRLLTASSSLDLLYEVDLEGNIVWQMDMWDTPFNVNLLGQRFSRKLSSGSNALLNPDPLSLKDDEKMLGIDCVLDDPSKYNNLGLPTNLTPVFINTASYGSNSQILTTSFHRGEGWIIDRLNNRVRIASKGLRNPHGFHKDPLLGGYIITDTGNEKVRFLNGNVTEELSIDFSNLQDRKEGLNKARWLQYTNRLSPNLYCAIIAPRQKLTLFDPINRTRRDIPFDPDWGIQMVVATASAN